MILQELEQIDRWPVFEYQQGVFVVERHAHDPHQILVMQSTERSAFVDHVHPGVIVKLIHNQTFSEENLTVLPGVRIRATFH